MGVFDFEKIKILIVDDDPDIRQLLKLYLINKFDCDVFVVGDGMAAVESLERNGLPDLIILDMNMPKMDGYEFLVLLRGNERTKDLPVIVCTTLGEKVSVSSVIEENVTDYILKPVYLPTVHSKIEKFLKKKITKFMEFLLDDEGKGYFYSDPFNQDFYIRILSVEGADENDTYSYQIGDSDSKISKVFNNPILLIPSHYAALKLTFKFELTKNKTVTIYFKVLKTNQYDFIIS
jgi:CheY-like chemotaxis protein